MAIEAETLSNKDRLYTTYLWLLSIASFYYVSLGLSYVQQIPFGKGIMGLIMMASELLLVLLAIRTYKQYYDVLNPIVRFIILFVVLYNTAHIVATLLFEREVAYLSLFGNPIYQPVFMLPFAFLVGMNDKRFILLYKFTWYYVLLMLPIYVFTRYAEPFTGIGILFLLAFAVYLPRKKRMFLVVFAALYIVYCYYASVRAAVMRAVMGGAIFLFSCMPLYKSNFIKSIIYVVIVAIPLFFLGLFVTTGYSVFELSNSESQMTDLSVVHEGDTRTFLYEEVFEDMSDNNSWILGKGVVGTYYSDFFDSKYKIEKENRIGVEVGWLFCLLKGGLVQVAAYMLLLLVASYRCLFQSNSKCVVLLGLVLLSHYVLLFIEDMPRYDLYNVAMWIYTGLSFSLTYTEREEEWFEEQFNLIFLKR